MGPAGACIPVASASPIHVLPIQRALNNCGAHIYMYSATGLESRKLTKLTYFCFLGLQLKNYRSEWADVNY